MLIASIPWFHVSRLLTNSPYVNSIGMRPQIRSESESFRQYYLKTAYCTGLRILADSCETFSSYKRTKNKIFCIFTKI